MNQIQIVDTATVTTNLGFGTAALMGRLGEKESLRLLARAYDEGIRYFDTAPSYGYGEAEALVGRFARTKRDIAIGTKFGLLAGGRSSPLVRFVVNVARPVARAMPKVRSRAGALARDRMPALSNFNLDVAKSSLVSSLRKLRRDCIDVFLLHECRVADLMGTDLLTFLSDAVRRGDIRTFGLGTDPDTIAYAATLAPEFCRVLQFENNVANRNIERIDLHGARRTLITHSPFGGVGNTLSGTPAQNLRFALRSNHGGIVLFSTTNEARVSANVCVAGESGADA